MNLVRVAGVGAFCALLAIGSGCSSGERVTQSRAALETVMTGGSSPTSAGTQDETAIAVVNFESHRRVVSTYNDSTYQDQIKFGTEDRFIYPGATLAGTSTSDDDGASWDYRGRVTPPSGWPVLWGDPAIITSRTDQSLVFISSLAVPDSKFPTSCPDGGAPCISGSMVTVLNQSPYLGGGCILRSVDAGSTFTANPNDCLHVSHHFYDGGSMAADNEGNVYAAWNDVVDSAVDVWRLKAGESTFQRLDRPFATFGVVSHPRLRYDVVTQRIYVMAQANAVPVEGSAGDYTTDLLLDWLEETKWSGAIRVTQNALLYPTIRFTNNLADPFARTGPQFSFDVGDPSVNNDDDIRVAFTARRSDGRRYVGVSRCPRSPIDVTASGSGKCVVADEWSTAYQAGQQWNPIVRTQLGFIGVPTDWRLSFTSTTDETSPLQVNWRHCPLAVIGSGTRVCVQFSIGAHRQICPDLRGQMGDYDDMQVLSISQSGQSTFIRAHSHSEPACSFRWQYTSDPLHLQSATF